ncbi:MAG: hypothetical protein HY327_00085 [Chloroflexi bacterium]|nr:hypothetical protein [Chloroflexota bacterium]
MRLTATAAPGFAAQQSALLFIRPNDFDLCRKSKDFWDAGLRGKNGSKQSPI